MKKFINDLLTEPDGKYSRKSIQMMIAFFTAIVIGIVVTFKGDVSKSAVDILDTLLIYSTGMTLISAADKKIKNKNTE